MQGARPPDRPAHPGRGPLIGDPGRFIDDEVQFRQFYCPACGGLLENEVWDIQLAIDG